MNLLSRICTLAIVCALCTAAVSWRCKDRLPDASAILPELANDPLQRKTKRLPYSFSYSGKEYVIEPVADYALSALVVSHNDIEAFTDIYHDGTSVDVKDLCVIWGDNVADNNFHKFDFASEPFSCSYHTNNRQALRLFAADQLSNNHLLAGSEEVRAVIAAAHIGDQVQFKGQLINYYPQGASEQVRRTSTVRTDTGNGACEVVMVDEMKVLSAANPGWQRAFSAAQTVLLFALLLKLGIFCVSAYLNRAAP